MSRDGSKSGLGGLSDELHLPAESLDRGSERAWRAGEFFVAGLILVAAAYIVASAFWLGPRAEDRAANEIVIEPAEIVSPP